MTSHATPRAGGSPLKWLSASALHHSSVVQSKLKPDSQREEWDKIVYQAAFVFDFCFLSNKKKKIPLMNGEEVDMDLSAME